MSGRRSLVAVLPVGAVVALIAAMAQLPLLGNHRFYLADDSAAQFLPTWFHLGELLRGGRFPLLDPSMWAGGNLAAEALFGLWNPLLLGNMVLVSVLPDLLVAAVVVKTEFLVILGLGVYGMAREYRVHPWLAVVAAVTVPFAGVTLYFDASSWASGLIAFAFVPHFWWTLKRSARGALTPVAPFVAGYLTVTSGNPYGTLGACLVVVAVGAECAFAGRGRRLLRVLLGGTAVGLVVPLVYLPLLLTQPVTYRNGAGVANNGLMVPGLADLVNASTPSFDAFVNAFQAPYLTVPATYLAWYLIPVLPWLRYDRLRRLLPAISGLLLYAGVALLLCVGPSDAWMFRWPLRVVPYLVLPIAVLAMVALSQGLARTGVRYRALGSAALVLAGAYLAESARPELRHAHAVSVLLEAALVTLLLVAFRRYGHRPALPVTVLIGGCVAVLAFQVTEFPRNLNFVGYALPTSVLDARAELAPRYPGTVLVVADNGAVQHSPDPARRSTELVFGNMFHALDVQTVNSYYGMGFQAFTTPLCMLYNGSTCRRAWSAVWQSPVPGGRPLADLLRLDTVVVENDLLGPNTVPVQAGWSTSYRDDVVTVLRRERPLPYPGGRLADAPLGTDVTEDVSTDSTEHIGLRGGPGGPLTFARLAWPGYAARLNGGAVPVRQGPDGLLTVDLPTGATGQLTVTWTPPGYWAGLVLALLGAMLAVATDVSTRWRRRRAAAPRDSDGHADAADAADAAGFDLDVLPVQRGHEHPRRPTPV